MTRRVWVLSLIVVMALALVVFAGSALAAPARGPLAGPLAGNRAAALTCTNQLVNSDMEATTGWLFGASAVPGAYSTAQFASPSHSVRLGITSGANVNSYSSMRQQVAVPTGGQLRLSLQVYPISQPVDAGDRQEILILDPVSGTTLRQVWSYIGTNAVWMPLQFDLSEFLGRNIVVYINVFNNGTGGITAMFVDNVTLEVCNNGGPTATPTPFVVTATPTPNFITATPTSIVVTATPTPIVVTATPTGPIVVTNTPTSGPIVVTNTPTPLVVTATPTSRPIVVTNTPTPIVVTATPTGPIVVTATPTSGPIVVTATPTSGPIVVTATPTAGAPVTVVPPAGCKNCIVNTGFENWGGWTLGNTLLKPYYQGTIVHTGLRALGMGNTGEPNYISYSSARQRVNLPRSPYKTAFLQFWRYTQSSGEAGDYQEFGGLNANTGQTLDVLWRQNLNENTWVMQQIDMTRYLGRDIIVYFNVYNNGGAGTASMYLDDVTLSICDPAGSGSSSGAAATVEPPLPPVTATTPPLVIAVTVIPPLPSDATVLPPVIDLLATASPSPDVWATIQASRSPTPSAGGDKESGDGGFLSDLWAFLRQPANCFLLLLILVVIGLIIWVSWRLLVSVNDNRNPPASPPAVFEAEEIPPPADDATPPDEW